MLHSHLNALNGLFWLLLGNYEEEKVTVTDPAFRATSICGHIFMIVYVICMVIVALDMLQLRSQGLSSPTLKERGKKDPSSGWSRASQKVGTRLQFCLS